MPGVRSLSSLLPRTLPVPDGHRPLTPPTPPHSPACAACPSLPPYRPPFLSASHPPSHPLPATPLRRSHSPTRHCHQADPDSSILEPYPAPASPGGRPASAARCGPGAPSRPRRGPTCCGAETCCREPPARPAPTPATAARPRRSVKRRCPRLPAPRARGTAASSARTRGLERAVGLRAPPERAPPDQGYPGRRSSPRNDAASAARASATGLPQTQPPRHRPLPRRLREPPPTHCPRPRSRAQTPQRTTAAPPVPTPQLCCRHPRSHPTRRSAVVASARLPQPRPASHSNRWMRA